MSKRLPLTLVLSKEHAASFMRVQWARTLFLNLKESL